LVAAVDGEGRTYRASRVREAQILDEPSTRPDGFDLAAYWEQSTAEFKANLPRYPARLRIASSSFPFFSGLLRYGRIERVNPPDTDGWQVVEVGFEVEEEALVFAAGFGGQLEVL